MTIPTTAIRVHEPSLAALQARGAAPAGTLAQLADGSVYVQADAPVGTNWILEKRPYASFGQNGVIFTPSHAGYDEP